VDKQAQQSESLQQGLNAEKLDAVLRQHQSLPTLPVIANKLLAMITRLPAGAKDAQCLEELLELISVDMSLSAKLISLANRCGGGNVRTLAQAAKVLGVSKVRSAVFAQEIFDIAEKNLDGLNLQEFWKHCIAVATAAEMLAENSSREIDPQEAYLCGLLHDIGKLALFNALPKSYSRVLETLNSHRENIADYERKIIGLDHATAGRRLAEILQLGERLSQVIWLHHQPVEAMPSFQLAKDLTLLVILADTVARRNDIGFSGNYCFPHSTEQLAEQLDISPESLDEIAKKLPAKVDVRAKLLETAQVSDASLTDTLKTANAELGKLYQQLQSKTSSLAQKAGAFDYLRTFLAKLTPQASIADILGEIAETIAAACNISPEKSEPIVAYSIEDDSEEITAVSLVGVEIKNLRKLPKNSDFDPANIPGNSSSPQEAMESLLADETQLIDIADLAAFSHYPLISSGLWIGGALVPRKFDHESKDNKVCTELAQALAMPLAIMQQRCKAMRISEELASASRQIAQIQESLSEAKNLAMVGEMAAGAAHELNNPLAVVSGRAQLMRERATDDEQCKIWELMAEQAQKISDIITDLMDFASPPKPKPEIIDPAELLKNARKVFISSEHTKAASAQVDIEIAESASRIWADRAQLAGVIRELIENAANVFVGEQLKVSLIAESNEFSQEVILKIKDNGPGIDAATLEKVFTPFFSSLRAGRRRGLGLPRAKRFIEINGGKIWIQSSPGQGTTVFLSLPARLD